MGGDVVAARQIKHQHLVQRRDRGEVKGFQPLHRREVRSTDPPLHQPAFAIEQFQLRQPQQEFRMIGALFRAFGGDLGILAQEGRQLQRLQMMRKQKLRRLDCTNQNLI